MNVDQPHIGQESQINSKCEPRGEALGERVGEVRPFSWSSAWIHGRNFNHASHQTSGGRPQELDELVDGQRWRQWCQAEPDLREFGSLKAVRELRGEAEDKALGALLRLAAADGYDDQLAGVAVLHQLGGTVRTIARHFWHLSGGDVEGIVVGAIWEQIRCHAKAERPSHHAAAIHHATRKVVRAALLPDVSRTLGAARRAPEPAVLGVRGCRGTRRVGHLDLDAFDSRDQLAIFLNWAAGQGVVDDEDIGLLDSLLDLDRGNPQIPKWLRGACSTAAVEHMAAERGVCAKSMYRARDKVLAKLRDAAPLFMDEVA